MSTSRFCSLHSGQFHALASVLIMAAEAGIDRIARRHQNLFHCGAEENAQRIEIIHAGKRFSLLPSVYGLWLIKTEVKLYVLN